MGRTWKDHFYPKPKKPDNEYPIQRCHECGKEVPKGDKRCPACWKTNFGGANK